MHEIKISRRVFIGATAYIVSAPLLASIFSSKNQIHKIVDNGQFFNAKELTILTDIAEIMIPKTDTPGATDVNVSSVLDGLMVTWAGEKTKQQYRYIISQLDSIAQATYQQTYSHLALSIRQKLIVELDKTAFDKQNTALSKSYRKLKEMIFHVYYTSELTNPDFVLIPGGYRGDITKNELTAIQKRGYL
ncbi:gluconate 2-dehydrogenase subunit 3 family protein [Aliiglaciecola sp. 3_MG-2023]|uniref:gluconate 2-dehydrogenase subunit 3 family protein n=1 Tax=Aliiglaciecola sp. 3_MG-2023 TaxID=3062644 RepID=UPI0026E11C04|nr:gluconate 2-dehydrogenase subunit 3 family protein [Aliiglaciecola sp. 3_MG-2023]MDO6693294.1 gluconate 2-dehydrogenase subunit 3 family protein [Aliiglaciecola sp. 3_MG-2023]